MKFKTNLRSFLIFFLLSIGMSFMSCTNSENLVKTLSPEDQDAIVELRNKLVSVIKEEDAEAYANLCSDNVRFMSPNAPIVTGREEVIKHNAPVFEAVKITTLILTPVDVYGVGDLAYEVGTQTVQIDPPLEGFKSSRKYLHVMRKSEDGT